MIIATATASCSQMGILIDGIIFDIRWNKSMKRARRTLEQASLTNNSDLLIPSSRNKLLAEDAEQLNN
jgi:hypothetical protein